MGETGALEGPGLARGSTFLRCMHLQPNKVTAVHVGQDDLPLIQNCLAAEGIEVEPAEDITRAARLPAQVVLCDADLPGWQAVLKEIHRLRPGVLVILMSHDADVRMEVEALSQGAYDLIAKPLRAEQLRAVVLNALRWELYVEAA